VKSLGREERHPHDKPGRVSLGRNVASWRTLFRESGTQGSAGTARKRTESSATRLAVTQSIAADDPVWIGVVGRFVETGRYLIITVYGITDGHEDF
jgi:hypothetical protein